MAKIQGVTLNIGGEDFVVPPLPLIYMPRFLALQEEIQQGQFTEAGIATLLDCAEAALRRNYLELTRDFLETAVDLVVLPGLIQALAGASGLVAKEPASGE